MSFGIGLGAFMDGFERGANMRQRIDDRREKRDNKAALNKIDADAREKFDQGVADGALDPDGFEQFWKDYALPMRRNELLRQGDIAGARALSEWGDSDALKSGGKHFSRALLHMQTGNYEGALDEAIQAGKVKGYIDSGYEITGHQPIQDRDGRLVGYRINATDADGKTLEQDVPLEGMERVISTFANPDAAWQSQIAAREAREKREREVADREDGRAHDRAELEDRRAYDEGQAARTRRREEAATEAARPEKEAGERAKEYDAAVKHLSDNDLNWSEYSAEERTGKINEHLAERRNYIGGPQATGLGSAGPAAPEKSGERVRVDARRGEIVEPQQQQPAPAQTAPTGIIQQPQGGSGKGDRLPDQNAIQQSLVRTQAKRALQQGASPDSVARQMRAVGLGDREIQDLLR